VDVTLNAGVQELKMVSAGGFNMISFDLQQGTVTPPTGGSESSISNIGLTWTTVKGSRITVHSTVTVVDDQGIPIEGIIVSGDWSGLSTGSASGATNSSG
jgi:hypothetical protein